MPQYECPTCKKVFTRPDNLKQHKQIHFKEKKHQCFKCDKTFHRRSNLLRHEKQVHEKRAAAREYKCNTCGERFHNLAPFRAHQKTAHSQPLPRATKRTRDDEAGKSFFSVCKCLLASHKRC